MYLVFFWVSMLCGRCVLWCFGGMYCFHLQDDWIWFTLVLKLLGRNRCVSYVGKDGGNLANQSQRGSCDWPNFFHLPHITDTFASSQLLQHRCYPNSVVLKMETVHSFKTTKFTSATHHKNHRRLTTDQQLTMKTWKHIHAFIVYWIVLCKNWVLKFWSINFANVLKFVRLSVVLISAFVECHGLKVLGDILGLTPY